MSTLDSVNIEEQTVNIEVFNQTEKALDFLREKFGVIPKVIEDTKTYDDMKKGLSELTKYRTTLEKSRKLMKQPYLDGGKIIDSEAKRITEELRKIEEPIKVIKIEYDERKAKIKAERIAKLQIKVDAIYSLADEAYDGDSTNISEVLEQLGAIDTESYYDLSKDAQNAVNESLSKLTKRYTEKVEYERAEKLRLEQEEINRLAKIDADIEQHLNRIINLPSLLVGRSYDDIFESLDAAKNQVIDNSFGGKQDDAQNALAETIVKLETMLQEAKDLSEFKAMKAEKEAKRLADEQKAIDEAKAKEKPKKADKKQEKIEPDTEEKIELPPETIYLAYNNVSDQWHWCESRNDESDIEYKVSK